jgi:tetratricopeptide (TPR) repeat protein
MKMPPSPDPFQSHLARATTLFEQGEVVQAGQIWQAILKRDPAHREARAGLYQVKLALERNNGEPDPDTLLQDGCTLFDLGQMRDALAKWERILARDPGHKLANAYANDARRELGLPVRPLADDPAGAADEPSSQPDTGRTESAELLVREGSQLYDMGMTDEAVAKWQRALALDPEQTDAAACLALARQEQASAQPPPPPSRKPAYAPVPDPDAPVPSVRPRVVPVVRPAYELAPIPLAVASPPPTPVDPPAAVTARSTPSRGGLKLNGGRRGLALPRWINTPRNLSLGLALLLVALLGLVLFGAARREAALKAAVAAAKQSALRPVSRMVEIPSLVETAEAVRAEAERTLAEDPLLAWLRAQEWQRLDPDNPAAATLAGQAKAKLGALPPLAPGGDFSRMLQSGDLDGARLVVLDQLRRAPGDPELRDRARTVLLALVPLYAGKDRLDDARDALILGRALFPQDKTWQAKLKLLEAIRTMTAADRPPWIQLLG